MARLGERRRSIVRLQRPFVVALADQRIAQHAMQIRMIGQFFQAGAQIAQHLG